MSYDLDDITEDGPLQPGENAPDEDMEDHTDFDAFWKKKTKKAKPAPTLGIFGQTITLPRSLPLQFQLEATRQHKLPKKKQDPLILLTILLGERQMRKLARAGLDLDQFLILLAWLPHKIAGSPMTLEEAAAEVEKNKDGDKPGED